MGDYSLGGGFNSGYGSGGQGLGGGYGGESTNNSGLGLGGNNNYGGGWGGSYGLADGYTGSSGLGFNDGSGTGGSFGSSSPGSFFGFNFSDFLGGGQTQAPSYSFSTPSPTASYGFQAPAAPAGPPAWAGVTNISTPGSVNSAAPVSSEVSFADSELGRNLRRMGLFAASQNPNANKAMGALGAVQALGAGEYGQGLSSLAGLGGVAGPVAGLAGIGIDAMTNPTRTYSEEGGREVTVNANGMPAKTPGRRVADMGVRTLTTAAGGALGGPFGAMLGNELGGWMNRQEMGPMGPTPSQNRNTEGNAAGPYQSSPEVQRAIDSIANVQDREKAKADPVGAIMGGLMGLYGINKMRGTAQGQERIIAQQQQQQEAAMAEIQAQMNAARTPVGHAPGAPAVRSPNFGAINAQLSNMFGPKSGVASELRSQLERKDAAAGRRSQYGPREVQLMSELTRLRAQAEPSYMNAEVAAANAANQGAFNLYNTQMGAYQNAQVNQRNQLNMLLNAEKLRGTNNAANLQSQFAAQNQSDQRRQQTLATLYGLGRESGAFKWAGDTASNWWNGGS